MDRRSFLKFMGVSAAATSASTLLANIPEAEPKIELLQPKDIITSIEDDVMVFTRVISYKMAVDENMRFPAGFSNSVQLLGKKETQGSVRVYLEPDQVSSLFGFNTTALRCKFNVPELMDSMFIFTSGQMEAGVGELTTATLNVVQIVSS